VPATEAAPGPGFFGRARRSFASLDPLDLAPRLTLALFLYEPTLVGASWITGGPLRLLAVAGLLLPPLHRSPWLWGAAAVALALKTAREGTFQDNHVYLLGYWTLALVLGFASDHPRAILARNGRLLVGLSFAFAVLWKAWLSPDFVSGAYFRFTLLTDGRFADATALVAGVADEDLTWNRTVVAGEAPETALRGEGIALRESRVVAPLAAAITAWTLVLESALALAFLWSPGRGPSRARDGLLLLFSATTYAVATVPTFGWTLLTLGLAQADSRRLRVAYLGVLALVVAYAHLPVIPALRAIAGR
jgi:hypothetical protein